MATILTFPARKPATQPKPLTRFQRNSKLERTARTNEAVAARDAVRQAAGSRL